MTKKFLFLFIYGITLSFSPAYSQDLSPAINDEGEVLKQVEAKKALLAKEVEQLEDTVEVETQHVIVSLDKLFQNEVSGIIAEHHKQVETAIENVKLPESMGQVGITISQFKAALGKDEEIKKICDEFVKSAQRTIEPLVEQLTQDIQSAIEPVLKEKTNEAQENIRKPFQASIAKYFPVYGGVNLPPAPLPTRLMPAGLSSSETFVPVLGIAGIVLIILRNVIKKLITKMTAKMAGKVLSKLIPYVGWILLAWEVVSVTQAKANLESDMRAQFIEVYRQEVTADTFWKSPQDEDGMSFQDDMTASVRELLTKWANVCREEVGRVMDAAQVMSVSPNAKDYMIKQKENNRNSLEVTEDLILVGKTFEPSMIALAPVEKLLDIIVRVPDKTELRNLVYTLGDSTFLSEYEKSGTEFLIAAHEIGTDEISRMIKGNTSVSWREAVEAYKTLEPESSAIAKRGLLILLETDVEYHGVVNSTLEIIGYSEVLFRKIAALLHPKHDRILRLISDDAIRETLIDSFEANPDLTAACLKAWPDVIWKRYSDPNRLAALLTVAAYRREERNESFESFAQSLLAQDDANNIHLEFGLDGVRIWDAYVTKESGDVDRQFARNALELYRKGFPAKDLFTHEGVESAQLASWLPFAQLRIYNVIKKLGRTVSLLFGIFLLILFLFVILLILKKTLPIVRMLKGRQERSAKIMQPQSPYEIKPFLPTQNILEDKNQNKMDKENEDC